MQRRILLLGASLLILGSIINWGCSKLDTTDIGSDQIPAVDNVHTFLDTLTVNTTQGIFSNDSTAVVSTTDFPIGKITGDALFGTTQADAFVQLKPAFFPFFYGNANDTINSALDSHTGFDSVVLCLAYKSFWGDSTTPVKFDIRTVKTNNGIWDSLHKIRDVNFEPLTNSTIIGTKTIDVRTLGGYFVYTNHRDSAVNQIRIKLDMGSFANLLYAQDSTSTGPNNALHSDSLFKIFNNGIAIYATGGNGLTYCNMADTNTKIEVHYRRKMAGTNGLIDTGFASFKLITTELVSSAGTIQGLSSTANHIVHNRSGNVLTPAATDIYIQTQPGTYANLKIPALTGMSNRIVHRAELIVTQIPDNPTTDQYFSAPSYLYVDLKDTTSTDQWKPLYLDLNPGSPYNPDTRVDGEAYYPASGIDPSYFGGYARDTYDKFGNAIKYYNINITRYVQQMVTKHTPNYTIRLWAPSLLYYTQMTDPLYTPYYNSLARGRVKVGSGTNTNYRMIVRIIYSNL